MRIARNILIIIILAVVILLAWWLDKLSLPPLEIVEIWGY